MSHSGLLEKKLTRKLSGWRKRLGFRGFLDLLPNNRFKILPLFRDRDI